MSFWGELRRRNVVKVAVAYAIVAWLVAQVANTFFPALQLPEWTVTFVAALLVLGFPIALILSWAYELTPEGIKKTRHVPLQDSITNLTSRRLNYVLTGLLLLAVAYLAVDNYLLQDSRGPVVEQQAAPATNGQAGESPPAAAQSNERAPLRNSVAVLPFENLSPDPDNAYFAAGMHEEILNQLAKLSDLTVISRTTMLQYAAQRKPLPEIGRELNVETVMEGSVRYAGNRIRITMQLIDALTDRHLWSETYERELDDIFAIESDIAMNVANALEATFSDEEQQRVEQKPTDSPVAYGFALQAFDLIGQGEQGDRMQELLDQAIAIDPDYADAYSFKAWLYAQNLINTVSGSAGSERAELEARIREYAEKALAVDPESARSWIALGTLASFSWRWSEATRAYNRAYEISNTSAFMNDVLWYKTWSGDQAEALSLAQRAVDLNPLSWIPHWSNGMILNYVGDYDQAARKFRDSIALAAAVPLQHSWLAMTEVARGELDEARRELELTQQIMGPNRAIIFLVDLAYGYGRIGDTESARRLFDEITALAQQGQDIGTGGWALANLAVGNTDEALEWLEQGAEKASRHEADAGYYSLMNIKMNYTADPVLERPEFVDVRNRLRGD
jgi:TolB-like protein